MAMVVSKAQSNEPAAQVCLALHVQCLDQMAPNAQVCLVHVQCLDQMAPNLRFDISMIFIINTESLGASSKPQEVPENGHGG